MKRITKLSYLSLVVYLTQCTPAEEVDLIVRNATVYTVDDDFSKAEAFAVKDGRFVAIGAEHEILNRYASSRVIDARKGVVLPGLVDAHSHLLGYGIELQRLDLVGTKSFEEVIESIQKHIETYDAQWVLGRGWDQNDWTTQAYPNTDTFKVLFPEHYIALKRVDGHAYMVSPNVLELAGVTSQTDIPGGKVVLDEEGDPQGILIDAAMRFINDVIPTTSKEVKIKGLELAQKNLLEHGLTCVCDAGISPDEVMLIDSLQQSGDLKMKCYAMYSASEALFRNLDQVGKITEKLRAKAVKLYADGALGSRGAYLISPYADDTTNRGLLITPKDSLLKWAELCKKKGFQMNVHCIGDGANRIVLDAMGHTLESTNDLRWRIEHAQVVHPEDRSKFGQFNIIPSMQPTHATSDMYWADERLGNRINHAYSLKSLMKENGIIPLGTDFPVEDINPINTFYAAVARKDKDGEPIDGFLPEEALSREEAIRGMTIWAAISNFGESDYGSIELGKSADFVLLDRDLMTCGEEDILKTNVLSTWIQGEKVYEK